MTRVLSLLRQHPIALIFILVAIAARVIFAVYTGRIWEDALITLTPARNAWEGFGLTHHASEPRVHSFTSPISVLIPLVGEAFQQGILALQIASLFAVILAIYYAYRIGITLGFPWFAHVLTLGYLSLDQLQVFFGITGMETQIATAVALANAYYLLSSQWWKLGIAVGMGLLSRPEFVFWLPVLGIYLLILARRAIIPVSLGTLITAGPWFAFATIYYGSPIANTIVAKSMSGRNGFGKYPLDRVLANIQETVGDFTPFYEMCFAIEAPLPKYVLVSAPLIVAALFLLGWMGSMRRSPALAAVGAFAVIFLVYRWGTLIPSYFMWYLPPFVALVFVIAAFGLTIASNHIGRTIPAVLACLIFVAYALPLPWSMPIERAVQRDIEIETRTRVGVELNRLMTDTDTAVMEPLGYTGWEARNKTIYDMPGLGSKVAVAALKNMLPYPSLEGLIVALKPNFVLLRPSEKILFQNRFPDQLASYKIIRTIQSRPDIQLSFAAYKYASSDMKFEILRRQQAE